MQKNQLTAQFLRIRTDLKDQELLCATINWHTAPICYSKKPSALINLGSPHYSHMAQLWNQYSKDYCNESNYFMYKDQYWSAFHFDTDAYKDMFLTPFVGMKGSLHLFCYALRRIQAICRNQEVRCFLREAGYSFFDLEYCIARLKKRFRRGCPHEIGIFLGYPLEDVKAFIQNKGRNYLLNGYWKVYSDVPGAIKMFDSFNKAKIHFLKQLTDLTNAQLSEKIGGVSMH